METPQNILVVVAKPKHDQVALQDLTGAVLHLAAFVHHPMYDRKDVFDTRQRRAIRREMLRERTEWLRAQVRDVGGTFKNITLDVVWTRDITAWVSAAIKETKFDLVLKSIHQAGTLLHTPLDWQLLRTCSAPLLLCTQSPWGKRPCVLAALDLRVPGGTHDILNRRVLDAAHLFAALYQAELHCVYTIELSEVLSDLDLVNAREAQRRARAEAEGLLSDLLAPYGVPASRVHMPMGKVGQAVNKVASKLKAELMVMGTTARKGVRGLIIGNSAEKVLTRARCDVLALKP